MGESEQAELGKAVQAIQMTVHSQQIYLFGSYAYGSPNKDSDLDLCAIVNHLPGRKLELMRKIRNAMTDSVQMSVYVLVYSAEEFSERAKLISTMDNQIKNKGVLVHG